MELNERLAVEQRPPAFDEPRKTCALCGSNHISYYHRDHRGISIFRCGVCGGQFMNPVYSDDHLREYYSHYVGDGFKLGEEESELYCHDYYLSLVERFMAASPGRLLDVGTGAGLLLKAPAVSMQLPSGHIQPQKNRPSNSVGMKIARLHSNPR